MPYSAVVIVVKNLSKSYALAPSKNQNSPDKRSAPKAPGDTLKNEHDLQILKNINLSIQTGSWTSLMGPSGSGKSTLLALLAGLDAPTSGEIQVFDTNITHLSEEEKAIFRSTHMGFVFQTFRLLPTLTALENVCVPLELLGRPDEGFALDLLQKVGLRERADHLPSQLSGGEQQRVAIARAFSAKPKVLFADEPTGNLDSKNGKEVLELLKKLQTENGSTLVIVTHDPQVAEIGNALIRLKDGEVFSQ